MATYDVFIHTRLGEIRTAVADEKGRLIQLDIDRPSVERSICGAVFIGRLTKIAAATDGAFIDIGTGQDGYLNLKDARPLANSPSPPKDEKVSSYLREGQPIMVQVLRDPVDGKGAKLTARPSLGGRFSVLTLGGSGIDIPPCIVDKDHRACLRVAVEGNTDKGTGVRVRTAAKDVMMAEFEHDLGGLRKTCSAIRAIAQKETTIRCVHRPVPPFARFLDELAPHRVRRIVCDDGSICNTVRRLCAGRYRAEPPNIEHHTSPSSLFEAFDLDEQIDGLCVPEVKLPSGARLTIEETAALSAIDVDSAQATRSGGGSARSHILKINLEAAAEAARQIRLRNLSGLIVIDMLKMTAKADRQKVRSALSGALEADPKNPQVLGFGPSGLIELTRKRTHRPLSHIIFGPCRRCVGTGRAPSDDTLAIDMLNGVIAFVRTNPGKIPTVSARRGIVAALRGRFQEELRDLEGRIGHTLVLKSIDREDDGAFRIEESPLETN